MKKDNIAGRRQLLMALRHFVSFFFLMCFVITCSMLLFLNTVAMATGVSFGQDDIETAAKLTFVNVIFLSLLCAVIDTIRRRIMVGRPVRKIIRASERIMQGDMSVRIEKSRSLDPYDGFDIVIDYFNRMAEELSGMESLRADFIANVSHEMKTPLAVIRNYAAMLRQPDLSEERRLEYVEVINDTSQNLANMVSNILKLNKLENQSIYPETQVYDLGEQLCECLLGFEAAWEEKQLEISTELEENVRIISDPELLSIVWNNLFSNAIKFTESGGRISLKLRTEGSDAVVEVSDTGCGISRQVGEHIFEKFYQGDTSHGTKGNGLGLALVKRVVDITGGDISVVSSVGEGSTFAVRLKGKVNETV